MLQMESSGFSISSAIYAIFHKFFLSNLSPSEKTTFNEMLTHLRKIACTACMKYYEVDAAITGVDIIQ